jgi:MFS family permease
MSPARLTSCVMLPFAAGYFLSYLFRTINAVIASDLAADLHLGPADLGFLTSIYFLIFAAVQLPFGALLDRHGPKLIQSGLLLLASAGSLVFALADGLAGLVIGRAFLALGVALALMAGFKAIVVWFPPGRVVLANGWLVMLGALGAVSATAPAEILVRSIGWRGLFAVLAGLSALAALFVLIVVPDQTLEQPRQTNAPAASPWTAYRDRRFWRIAPLSAVGVGTSWSLQGLWAAPWLRDVEGLERAAIVQHLSGMAIAVCVAALFLATVASRLRRVGITSESTLAMTVVLSMTAQAALVLGCSIPSLVLWTVIAATGAATVLSFAILAEYFPQEVSGRANAALNLLHVSAAFVLQSAMGIIIAQWPQTNGGYAVAAHEAAMTAGICVQLLALGWFALPRRGALPATGQIYRFRPPARTRYSTMKPPRYAAIPWRQHERLLRQHTVSWRVAAAASTILCTGLSTALWATTGGRSNPIQVFAADQSVLASAWGQAVPPSVGWLSFPAQLGQSVSAAGRHP